MEQNELTSNAEVTSKLRRNRNTDKYFLTLTSTKMKYVYQGYRVTFCMEVSGYHYFSGLFVCETKEEATNDCAIIIIVFFACGILGYPLLLKRFVQKFIEKLKAEKHRCLSYSHAFHTVSTSP